ARACARLARVWVVLPAPRSARPYQRARGPLPAATLTSAARSLLERDVGAYTVSRKELSQNLRARCPRRAPPPARCGHERRRGAGGARRPHARRATAGRPG